MLAAFWTALLMVGGALMMLLGAFVAIGLSFPPDPDEWIDIERDRDGRRAAIFLAAIGALIFGFQLYEVLS